MFKKVLAATVLVSVMVVSGFAANPFDEFKNQLSGQAQAVAQDRLDTFAKDLGVVLGGGSFHQGETLGLLGFDVGVQVPAWKVDDKNAIVKAAGIDTIALPILQVEKGLPWDIDIIGRFTSYTDATMYGVGLRYGLYKSDLPVMPGVSVQAVYNSLNVDTAGNKLSATAMTVDAVISIGLPIVSPYAGIGITQTEVSPDSTITNLSGKASGMHLEGGVNLSLIPFTYLKLAATLNDGNMGYDAGLGVKF